MTVVRGIEPHLYGRQKSWYYLLHSDKITFFVDLMSSSSFARFCLLARRRLFVRRRLFARSPLLFFPLAVFFPSPFVYGDVLFFCLCVFSPHPSLFRSFSFVLHPRPFLCPLSCACVLLMFLFIFVCFLLQHTNPLPFLWPLLQRK